MAWAYNSYLTVIGVHEMPGQMHPNYCQITILLVIDLCLSLAYFMMTHPLPIASKLPIKTLVARQLPTNTHTHTAWVHAYTHTHMAWVHTYTHNILCTYTHNLHCTQCVTHNNYCTFIVHEIRLTTTHTLPWPHQSNSLHYTCLLMCLPFEQQQGCQ